MGLQLPIASGKKWLDIANRGKAAVFGKRQDVRMTTKTKMLLVISLTSLAISSTGVLWGIFLPVSAITFGLFLILKLLARESALFDAEQRMRTELAENCEPASEARQPPHSAPIPSATGVH